MKPNVFHASEGAQWPEQDAAVRGDLLQGVSQRGVGCGPSAREPEHEKEEYVLTGLVWGSPWTALTFLSSHLREKRAGSYPAFLSW